MKLHYVLVLLIGAVLQPSFTVNAQHLRNHKTLRLNGDRNVVALLEDIRRKYRVPAIAGAIVKSEGIATIGVTGVRKRGTTIPVTLNDKWHVGSNTKAMTATMIAKLIEQGHLTWNTTIAEVFPQLNSTLHPTMKRVTILQLLSHRSGLPENLALANYRSNSAPQERLRAVRQELTKSPRTQPGTHYQYSNLGYIIAGAIVEKRTGASWEVNMTTHLFRPLKMLHASFGGVGTPGKIDQPWGHRANGHPVGQNGSTVDNPPVMGPAGRVHCTLQDWAKFIADHLRGRRRAPSLLRSSYSYQRLHTPPFGGAYALGWWVTKRQWGGGTVLHHSGSNTMNFATVWVAPRRNFAVLVCINQGGGIASRASDAAVSELINYHRKIAMEYGD